MKLSYQNLILLVLLWSFALSSKAQTTVTYIKDNSLFPNPERGWQMTYNPNPATNEQFPVFSIGQLEQLRNEEKISLVDKYYILNPYRNSKIPQSYLDNFQKDMDALREVGLKAVIRFAYNFNANDLDDAPKNRVLEHITQLKPYLEENYDVIAFMEAGFIGKWAEWHGSSNNLLGSEWSFDVNQNTRDIYAALMDALPSNRMMAFRYIPQIQNILNQTTCENNSGVFHEFSESIAFSGSDRARTGRQDDWFFGNNGSNSGTWSGNSAIRECQKDYLEELSKYVPISTGETQEFSDYSKNTSPIADLKRFHYASLSMNPGNEGQTLINHWKSNGIYNEMAKRFGYRLSLITSTAPTQLANNGTLSLSITIKNDGFGTPYNPRLFEVILRNQSTSTLFKYDITNQDGNNLDPRWWFWENGQMSKNINISVGDIPKGKYDVLLHLPDPAPKLYGRPEYSIRLANENTWEASTGFT